MEGKIKLVTSDPLIEELKKVAQRPEMVRKYPQVYKELPRIVDFLAAHSVGNPSRFPNPVIPQDPEDERVLECALAAKADYIVSGNRHLLNLGSFKGIPVLSPATFLASFVSGYPKEG